MNRQYKSLQDTGNIGTEYNAASDRSILALDALSKLTKQFAEQPDFKILIDTILLTLSGQFAVADSFALLYKPGGVVHEMVFSATGKYSQNIHMKSLFLTPEISRYYRQNNSFHRLADKALPDDCSSYTSIFTDSHVELICPIVHNDKMLGLIGLGRKIIGRSFNENDIALFDALTSSILPLIISSYHFHDVINLSAWHLDIINNVKHGVFVFDVKNRLLKINTTGLEILKSHDNSLNSQVDLQGRLIENVFPDDVFKGWAGSLITSSVEGRGRLIDNLTAEVGGITRFYEAYLKGIAGGVEFHTDYIVTVEDVTGRKLAEVELIEGREMLGAIIDSTNDGILVVDKSGKIIRANAQFLELWKSPKEYIEPGAEEKLWLHFLNQLKYPDKYLNDAKSLNGTADHSLVTLEFKDGRVYERYSCPLMFRNEINGRVWNFRDITNRVNAEKQEEELRNQLERAERMKSLGILAGGVAHDLNNMLGPLVGYPELMLLKLPEDSPIRKQVKKIAASAKQAADVVQDLLALARRGRYEMTPVDLNGVVREYLETPGFEKRLEVNNKISLKANLDNNIGKIMGSVPHLSKVIMNLIVNAFDVMPDGGLLTITTLQKNCDKLIGGEVNIVAGDYIILSVSDTGTGIKPEDIDKIFEPYFSKKQMGTSGSGLGLSVVYGIVKDHKGYYDILSTIGEGTEFILYFPVTFEQAKNETESEMKCGDNEKVLIIDDVAVQREITSEILTSLGYRVEAVDNGRKAVKHMENNKFDIVVLDMIMEKNFDGLDTYKEILKKNPSQKAIIISGLSATKRVKDMQQLGAGVYIKKPYTRGEIGQAIRQELDRPVISR